MGRTERIVSYCAGLLAISLAVGCTDDADTTPAADTSLDTDGTFVDSSLDGEDAGDGLTADASTADSSSDAGGGEEPDASSDDAGGFPGIPCIDIVDCINSSELTDAAVDECIARGSSQAQQEIIDVLTCLDDNCSSVGSDEEYSECQEANCRTELEICFGGTLYDGDENCEETVNCLIRCTHETCANGCTSRAATGDVVRAAIQYVNCGAMSCPGARSPEEFIECADLECPDESAACF